MPNLGEVGGQNHDKIVIKNYFLPKVRSGITQNQ